MVKSIIKEICIMLLLCIAIVLILGVIFYDSIPANKVVPNKLAEYKTPENVQSEIDETITEMNKIEVSYEVTDSDLSLYKQTHSYTPGKPDPFAASTSTNTTTNQGGNGVVTNSTTNTNTSTNTNNVSGGSTTNTDPNSTGTFFNNTGLK